MMAGASTHDAAEIELDAYERDWALEVGSRRNAESERRNETQSDGSRSSNGKANHQRGAAGELAFVKFVNSSAKRVILKWNGTINTYNSFPDLDGTVEIRSRTDGPWRPYLQIKDKDRDKTEYIFVSITRLLKSRFGIDGRIEGAKGCNRSSGVWILTRRCPSGMCPSRN